MRRLLFLAVLAFPATASARELAYTPAEGCPAEAEVDSRIQATSPKGRPAIIAIEKAGGAYSGVVTIGSGDRMLTRSVEAKSCSAVVDALALVVALDREPDDPPEEPAPPPPPEQPVDADRAPPPPRASHPDITIGAGLGLEQAMHHTTLVSPTVYVDVAASGPKLDIAWLRPSARILVARGYATRMADTNIVPRLTTVAAEGCPLGWPPARTTFVASACARGELGALEVSTRDDTAGTTRLWSAIGAEARARLVVGSPGSLRWAIDAGLGFVAPLRRDRYEVAMSRSMAAINPFSVSYPSQIPAIAGVASLGVGLVLP